MSIQDNLKKYMEYKGIKAKELASLSGVPASRISEIGTGITLNPQMKTLRKLADALEIPVSALTEGLQDLPLEPNHHDLPELTKIFVRVDDAGRATIMAVARTVCSAFNLKLENERHKQSGAMVGDALIKKCEEVENLERDERPVSDQEPPPRAVKRRKRKPSVKEQLKEL